MKSERVLPNETYLVVRNGREIKVKVDCVVGDYAHGQDVETKRGIALPTSYFRAGPLRLASNKDSVQNE